MQVSISNLYSREDQGHYNVFATTCNMVFDWLAQHWTAEDLSELLHGKPIGLRMGLKSTDPFPQFETLCNYVGAIHPVIWAI